MDVHYISPLPTWATACNTTLSMMVPDSSQLTDLVSRVAPVTEHTDRSGAWVKDVNRLITYSGNMFTVKYTPTTAPFLAYTWPPGWMDVKPSGDLFLPLIKKWSLIKMLCVTVIPYRLLELLVWWCLTPPEKHNYRKVNKEANSYTSITNYMYIIKLKTLKLLCIIITCLY